MIFQYGPLDHLLSTIDGRGKFPRPLGQTRIYQSHPTTHQGANNARVQVHHDDNATKGIEERHDKTTSNETIALYEWTSDTRSSRPC